MTETLDWRRCRWEATHRRIFTTALAMFEDFGYEQVSVGGIAKRAEVSVPTFYAHYPSKEHLIMAPLAPEDVTALLAGQPADLPAGERVRRATARHIAELPPDESATMLSRWRIIARTPALRTRAAEFERATADMVLQALPAPATAREVVQVGANFAAFTAGLLAWADSDGRRELEETLAEAFEALSD